MSQYVHRRRCVICDGFVTDPHKLGSLRSTMVYGTAAHKNKYVCGDCSFLLGEPAVGRPPRGPSCPRRHSPYERPQERPRANSPMHRARPTPPRSPVSISPLHAVSPASSASTSPMTSPTRTTLTSPTRTTLTSPTRAALTSPTRANAWTSPPRASLQPRAGSALGHLAHLGAEALEPGTVLVAVSIPPEETQPYAPWRLPAELQQDIDAVELLCRAGSLVQVLRLKAKRASSVFGPSIKSFVMAWRGCRTADAVVVAVGQDEDAGQPFPGLPTDTVFSPGRPLAAYGAVPQYFNIIPTAAGAEEDYTYSPGSQSAGSSSAAVRQGSYSTSEGSSSAAIRQGSYSTASTTTAGVPPGVREPPSSGVQVGGYSQDLNNWLEVDLSEVSAPTIATVEVGGRRRRLAAYSAFRALLRAACLAPPPVAD